MPNPTGNDNQPNPFHAYGEALGKAETDYKDAVTKARAARKAAIKAAKDKLTSDVKAQREAASASA